MFKKTAFGDFVADILLLDMFLQFVDQFSSFQVGPANFLKSGKIVTSQQQYCLHRPHQSVVFFLLTSLALSLFNHWYRLN